jgi:anti-sigma factor RsiW
MEDPMADHRPYSEWITAGETLPADDERRLQAHLAGCAECRDLARQWAGVAALLTDAKEWEPRAGFAGRWKALAAAREAAPKARQAWIFVAASGFGAVLLALGLISQNIAQGGSFADAYSGTLADISTWVGEWAGSARIFGQTAASIYHALSPLAWLGIIFLVGLICAIWLIALYRVSHSEDL